MHAYDIMTRKPISISCTASARDALDLIVAKGVGGLMVLDDSDQVVGIVTEYVLLEVACDAEALNQPIARFMTRDVISVEEETPVHVLADQFIHLGVRRLPVVSRGRLVGVVTRGDVLRYISRELLNAQRDTVPSA